MHIHDHLYSGGEELFEEFKMVWAFLWTVGSVETWIAVVGTRIRACGELVDLIYCWWNIAKYPVHVAMSSDSNFPEILLSDALKSV